MGPVRELEGDQHRRERRAVWIENALIYASILALWPWIFRGRWVFKGPWVWIPVGGALVAMVVVAVRRISRWNALRRRDGGRPR